MGEAVGITERLPELNIPALLRQPLKSGSCSNPFEVKLLGFYQPSTAGVNLLPGFSRSDRRLKWVPLLSWALIDAVVFTFKDIPLWRDHCRGPQITARMKIWMLLSSVLLLSNLTLTDTSVFHCRLGSQGDSQPPCTWLRRLISCTALGNIPLVLESAGSGGQRVPNSLYNIIQSLW